MTEDAALHPRREARIDPATDPRRRLRRWRFAPTRHDLFALAAYALGAVYVTCRLWVDVRHRIQSDNVQDQIFFEWVLARGARAVTHLENPFFTTSLNSPSGVNMMANTSVLAIAVPLTPITLIFGSQISYAVMLTLGLAGTATAWYLLLSRHVVSSRLAAAVGAGFCGFGPAMVSHANGHPNIVAQFLVPLIVWRVIRLREIGGVVRNGIVLGLLITYQFFVNEEILLFTALATGAFVGFYALQRRGEVQPLLRRYLAGLGTAGAIVGLLCAYPLWVQFLGPQHYSGVGHWFDHSTDLSSYVAFPRRSLAMQGDVSPSSFHPAEENAMLGWPLVVLVVALMVWLRSNILARCVAAVGALFALLSLGPAVTVGGTQTDIPGPWAMFSELPVVETVVATRLGLVVVPSVGIILALGLDKALHLDEHSKPGVALRQLATLMAYAVALVPILPQPLLAQHRDTAPPFITDGGWRSYVAHGEALVPVPLPTYPEPTGMSWSAQAQVAFPIPGGYFLGPKDGTTGDIGDLAPPTRRTAALLADVERAALAATVTDSDRQQARSDLEHWNAGVVVLDVRKASADPLRQTLDDLLGPGTQTAGVWFWDV